jgi:chromosome segregation ATPase
LQRLEALESRVSLVSSSSLSISSSTPQGQTLEAAIKAALHLLERLFVSMQCLAADAAIISNASNACKVKVLVGGILQGLEAAAGQQQQQQQQGSGPPGAAASLVLLRNAAGAAGKQRCSELERQLATMQLQLADTMSQLVSMSSANARLQRMLNLKTRAAASLERQVGAGETQLQHMQAQQAAADSSMVQLQQELAAARLQQSKAAAECSTRAAELQAAQSRADAVEAALQQLQAAAEATEASTVQLTERLQQAMDTSRQEVTATAAAQRQHAAAALQAEQLQQQLTVASERVAELEKEVRECRHKVDICSQAARNAEYRAVETTTRLADLRREFDLSQQQQPTQQQRLAAG